MFWPNVIRAKKENEVGTGGGGVQEGVSGQDTLRRCKDPREVVL